MSREYCPLSRVVELFVPQEFLAFTLFALRYLERHPHQNGCSGRFAMHAALAVPAFADARRLAALPKQFCSFRARLCSVRRRRRKCRRGKGGWEARSRAVQLARRGAILHWLSNHANKLPNNQYAIAIRFGCAIRWPPVGKRCRFWAAAPRCSGKTWLLRCGLAG